MFELSIGTLAAIAGLIGGIGLGFCARWGRFCTLAAIENASFARNFDGIRMWGLAIAVAVAGTYCLDYLGYLSIQESFYLARPTSLIATAVGGLMFGYGMALVGTCGYGMLARVGGGDLKSVVTFLVMGISAYATLNGATSYFRVYVFPHAPVPEIPAGFAFHLADWTGFSLHIIALLFVLLLCVFVFYGNRFHSKKKEMLTGILVGLFIVWGWAITAYLGKDDFTDYPLESYTFTAPLGETILYFMAMTGSSLKFGIGATVGVIIGAFLTTIAQGYFRWEACDDARELRRQIFGGFLMGVGGVVALGCTVGQGLSAASTLAFSAPLALLAMFIGAWIGLHALIQGSYIEPIRQLFSSDK